MQTLTGMFTRVHTYRLWCPNSQSHPFPPIFIVRRRQQIGDRANLILMWTLWRY